MKEDFTQFSMDITSFTSALRANLRRALDTSLTLLRNTAKERCPRNKSLYALAKGAPGQLRESIFIRSSGLRGVVGTNKEYAIYVHEGRKGGYIIKAKNAKALKIPYTKNVKPLFTKSGKFKRKDTLGSIPFYFKKWVYIRTSTKPQPFFTQSIEYNKDTIDKLIGECFDKF